MADTERLINQLLQHNNWLVIEEIDNSIYFYVYNHLPPRIRYMVELKLEGYKNDQIANRLNTSNGNIRSGLSIAKGRFINGMFGILDHSHQHRLWKSDSKRHKRLP